MALVVKVKCQGILRRWVATEDLNTDSFPVSFGQLEAKIKELFQLSPSTSLAITYVDNDKDVVTLANDQDLIDACVVQRLNPLRLDVQCLGDNSNSSEGERELPRSSDPPKFPENVNLEAFLNAVCPHVTADAVKAFVPFFDLKLPASAWLAKVENALKEFRNGLAAGPHEHSKHLKFTERFAPQHPNKHPCHAMSSPHVGDKSFHWGIECDSCGMSPIEGARYKSIKEMDYDLCASCFKTIGNDNDYEKLDRPVCHPPHNQYRPACFRKGARPFPAPPGCRASFAREPYGWKPHHPFTGQRASGYSASDEHKKLDARFVKDVTIFDGTELTPGAKFTKIWRMCNIGSLPWPQSAQLVHIGGDKLCPEEIVPLELPGGGLPCGEEVEISVDLVAPKKAGRYVSHWRLTAPSGQKFGHRVWVVIHVVPEGEHSPQFQASLENGKSSIEVNKESMDVDLDGANTVTLDVDLNGANRVVLDVIVNGEKAIIEQVAVEKSSPNNHENVQPSIVYPDPLSHDSKDVEMSIEKSMDSGTSDLLVYPDPISSDSQGVEISKEKGLEGDAGRKNEVDGFSLVEKPTESTDWLEVVQNESLHTPEGPNEEEESVQESLLHAMESMGFADRNVNISVLQKCNFVLQEAADDLLVAAGWDGALKDLEEMGFNERATNIRLLVKNKGSLKPTVRDLVKLEKMVVED